MAESLKSMQELSKEDMPKVQQKMADAQEKFRDRYLNEVR
jgi:hypothetical protein